eukprot:1954741-Pyramimonas_sp.AAC.1
MVRCSSTRRLRPPRRVLSSKALRGGPGASLPWRAPVFLALFSRLSLRRRGGPVAAASRLADRVSVRLAVRHLDAGDAGIQ